MREDFLSTGSLTAVESPAGERRIALINERWYFTFFLISGFCGLVYEVIWLRLSMASFGVTSALTSIVISMFMAGLGVGSWGTGVLVRRKWNVTGRGALRLYALTELLIGISSFAVPFLLQLGRTLLQRSVSFEAWQSSRYYLFTGVWMALTLIPWCACMGATFPFLMAAIKKTHAETSERSFSYLYVANVLGALAGTLVSAFILIELLGFHRTLYFAGTLNVAIAILALRLSFQAPADEAVQDLASLSTNVLNLSGLQRRFTLVCLFSTGLVSMGLEVIWIRQYTPYLGNVVYAFAGILAVYLFSTALGSTYYRNWSSSVAPAESFWDWSLLAVAAVLPVIAVDPVLPLKGDAGDFVRLLAIVFFSGIAGFLTPMLVDSWSGGDPDRAGRAYAVNVAGSILGPLLAGFWLLPKVGERWATILITLPLFAIAALTAFASKSASVNTAPRFGRKARFVAASVVSILLVAFSHDYENKFRIHQVKRDYTATVLAVGRGANRGLIVNGVGMTSLNPITKYMAHLPLASMGRPPKNGLVICFGMGTSFRSMTRWGIPTTAVDLVPSVPQFFPYFHEDAAQIESSPLAHIVVDDGRRFLDSSNQKFDVIIIDPPPPTPAAGSSLLYSVEFYEVVKAHLSDDGVLQAWYPAQMGDAATLVAVTKSLQHTFKYVRAYVSLGQFGIHYLASMQPIPQVSSAVLASRLPPAAAADFVEWGPGRTPEEQFQIVLGSEVLPDRLLQAAPNVPAIRDDRPINEYYLLRSIVPLYR
jgi:spermidine synthase